MNTLKYRIPAALLLCLSIIIALLPFVLVPVCPALPNGMHMPCYYSGILVTVFGVILAVLAVLLLFLQNVWVQRGLSLLALLICFFIYAVPHRILLVPYGMSHETGNVLYMGTCGNPAMPDARTFAILSYLLLGAALCSLVIFLLNLVKGKFTHAE